MDETELQRLQREALADPDAFWAREVADLPWFSPWETVLEWTPPTFSWFKGATTNITVACLDRHVAGGFGERPALNWLREDGAERRLTYAELLTEVERVAAALRALGIGHGDRVTLSMPVSVEAIALMLACARIGAIHSVVFAGFGEGALGQRIRLSGSKAVFTADSTRRRGKVVPLKHIVDAALADGDHDVEHVIVQRREPDAAPVADGELDWDDFLAAGAGSSGAYAEVAATDPVFILATSGTTATPKLVVHVHGGYMAGLDAMGRWVYGLERDDIWWSTSDIGWIVGHSYIVYGPLLAGAATIAFEGSLDHPGPDTLYRLIAQERVTGLFTAPTAVRMLMQHGTAPADDHDLSTLTRVFCAGETLNPPAWEWLQRDVLGDRVPVIDHMWQTETGVPLFANPWGLGLEEIRPVKEVCGDVHLKAILETGELSTYDNVRRASWLALIAGADVIKTSTGKVSPAATHPVALVMLEAVRDFHLMTGEPRGVKVAGGIRTTKDALRHLVLVNETLGADWLTPQRYRIGASGLLTDLLMQRQKLTTGVYGSADRITLD